jgi:hypothetical protein
MINLNGPFQFGSDDPSVICSAKLTGASELGCGALINAGAQNYSSNGILLAATGSWVFSPSASERAELFNGGTLSFEIEQGGQGEGALDVLYGGGGLNQDVCGWDDGATDDFYFRVNGVGSILLNHNGALSPQSEVRPSTMGTHATVWVTWDNSYVHFYMNGLRIRSIKLPGGRDSAEFTNICLGRNTLSTGLSVSQFRYRNVQISTKRIQNTVTPLFRHINFYGDSFVKLGQYGTDTNEQDITAVTGDGSSGATFDGQDSHDGGFIPVMQKTLAMQGRFVGGERIHAWHQGGTGVLTTTPMSDRVDISVNGKYPMPTLSVFFIGTNDASDSGTTLTDITDGTWAAAYQASLDKVLVGGAKAIICTMPPAQADSTLNTDTVKNKQYALNDAVSGLVAANSDVYLADIWNLFGGDNFDPLDFGGFSTAGGNDRHPSQRGHTKIGDLFGRVALEI